MEKNKNVTYIIIALLVIVVLFVVLYVWKSNSMPQSVNTQTGNEQTEAATGDVNPVDAQTETRTVEEIEQVEEERLAQIQAEREKLLAQQAELEKETAASTSSDANTETDTEETPLSIEELLAQQQRAAEIEFQLLELRNQEEYPPLPDPSI